MSTEKVDYLLLFRGTNWDKGMSPEQIQKVVTETIRANPNVAQTYTILGYQLYGSKWPGFDYPDSK